MRPQSRMLSKRRLQLPTITEEMLRDRNQTNTLHSSSSSPSTPTPSCALSSEDYRLSICHLAHPTFPIQDTSSSISPAHQQADHPQHAWPPRPGGNTAATAELLRREETGVAVRQPGETKDSRAERLLPGYRGNSDPLEYLYGHRDGAALSVCPSGSSQRRRLAAGGDSPSAGQAGLWASAGVPASSGTGLPRQQHHSSWPELDAAPASPPAEPAHRHTGGSRQAPALKHSLISQWISDCRSAWRQARLRACMLPAIAEI